MSTEDDWVYNRMIIERTRAERDEALATVGRLRQTLMTIQQWDMLNPPQTDRVSDLGWLRRLVDRALEEPS